MRQLRSIFFLVLLSGTIGLTGSVSGQSKIAEIMRDRSINWKEPQERAQAVKEIRQIEERNLRKAEVIAKQRGKPLREKLPNGKVRELVGLDEEGELLYVETKNVNAAISTGANFLHSPPYSVDGSGLIVGVWDADSALVTHQEFNEGGTSRVSNVNTQPFDNHATHVAGTIAAFGVDSGAKGMAFQALIDSYDWTSDVSEMTAAGATSTNQFESKVYLSNHSYGFSYGWRNDGGWIWTGTGTDQDAYDADFGQYSGTSVNLDNVAYNAPYYLIFWAAGNENNDGPNNGNTVTIGGSSVTVTYDSAIHPQNDGDYRNGFETIGDHGVAKNLITVGAANDAVNGGQRDPSRSTIASFSSTGPTDDGRIKPDLVGNGVGLRSPLANSNTAYGNFSGTSMASPNLTGSAALLVALYRDLFGSTAAMRSSTLKALLIHTASDVGNPGPDYTYGWGLPCVKTAADLLQRQADFPDLESVVEDQLTTAQPIQSYSFSWDGVSEIRATLCWTDAAGNSESAHDDRTPDLVNDLNLKLIAPDGTEYFPFVMPFVGTWTVASMSQHATTGVNNTDNVEQVLVQTPGQAGIWQAEITYLGTLTNSAQDYGLIISGSGTAGSVNFNPSTYAVSEDGGSAAITVSRDGGSTGAVSVDYVTSDGTAISASDYTTTTGTLSWADGESGAKSFSIPITNDAVSETYEETFSVMLSNPVGIQLSGTESATVTIVDDEPAMGVLSPNGGEALSGGAAYNITWASGQSGDVRIELLKNGIIYTTVAASTPDDGLFEWTVPQTTPTGSDYRIRITRLSGGGESDTSNATFSIDNQSTATDIYAANLDVDPGWTLQGGWEYGVPKGNGGDPSSGNTGNNVIGYNLDGQYTNNLPETCATTMAIDCSDYTDVTLSFYRWLGVESSTWDQASIRVSNDGISWTTVWQHSGNSFTDGSWQDLSYDISAIADQQPEVFIRWVMGATDGSVTYAGWNIDDIVISGLGSYVNPAGEVVFSSANYQVSEGVGSTVITVDRIGGATGSVSVDYATRDGTATVGADYTATTGTLTWADGDGSSKTFSVTINDDADHEDFLETIQLTLSNVVAATLTDNNLATLTIEDNDNNAPSADAGPDQFAEWQEVTTVPGLAYGTVPGNIDKATPNPATQILVDVSSETENSIAANTTEIYTGSIYDADGQISFTEHIDDKARIWIDGNLVLSDDDWRNRTSTANLNLNPGWHTIEIRISNGTGGSGPNTGVGIGYDPAGGTAWQTLVDPGDGSFLRVNQDISGAEVDLAGTASDLDGDPLATSWSMVSGPQPVSFGDASALNTKAEFEASGVYTLRLTVDDGRGPVSDDVVITVGAGGLQLDIDSSSIPENGGSMNATVTRLGTSGDLVINLSSDDISEATVPASVTVLDGQTSADFTITAVDDAVVDGTQTVTITAGSAGNSDQTATIDVTDEVPFTLTVVTGPGGDATTGGGAKDPDATTHVVTASAASGFQFVNWTVTAGPATVDDANAQNTTITASTDATVQANFTPVTYSVFYSGNGNEGGSVPVDASSPYDSGSTVTVLGNPGGLTRSGFTLVGWNTAADGSGTNYTEGSTFTIDADTTLHANWNRPPNVVAGDDQTVYISAGNVWSPAEITTALWLDADDAESLNLDGSSVTQWNDKSGNANHLTQPTGTEQPTTGLQTIGGRNALDFDDDFMQTTAANNSIRAVFFVSDNLDGSNTSANVAPIFGEATANASYTFVRSNSTEYSISIDGNNNNTGAASVFGNTPTTGDNINLGLSVVEKEAPLMWYAEYSSNVSMDFLGLLTSNQTFHLVGTVGEFIALESVPSETDRQKIEGYLAHKWGLSGNLPVDHPYKNAAPGGAVANAVLNGSVDDLDGDSLTQQWTKEAGPAAAVTFADDSAATTSAFFTEVGVYTLRLSADDGLQSAFDEVDITVELPPLGVSIAAAEISENGGTTTATITRIGSTGDLELTLSSSDTGEATVPATATILDGATSVDVTVTGVPDGIVDSTETVTITASADNNADGSDTVDVTNVDTLSYSVTYDGNGNDVGSAPVDGNAYNPNDSVTVLGNTGGLTKANHIFGGWNTASDGSGTSYAADDTFTITESVTLYAQWSANEAPVANNQSLNTLVSAALSITLTASDADDDPLSYSVVTGPVNGTLSGTAPNLTYTPNAGYSGSDSFTFTANDGTLDSNTATVSTTVISPYEDWAGEGSSPENDSNGDGIADGIAWVLGANDPASDVTTFLPTLDAVSDPNYVIFIYRRSDAAHGDSNTMIEVKYGSDLSSWTTAVHDGSNVIITETDDHYAAGVDQVEVKLHKDLATGGKMFTRLSVVIAP